jgi:hypothetical protein
MGETDDVMPARRGYLDLGYSVAARIDRVGSIATRIVASERATEPKGARSTRLRTDSQTLRRRSTCR